MKNVIVLVLLVLICSFSTAAAQQRMTKEVDRDGFNTIRTENEMGFKWKVEGKNLHVVVSAKSKGWVAVGFDPADRMQGANFIIGYVKRGEVFIRDEYGTKKGAHAADTGIGGSDDVLVRNGTEENGITEIEFVIPLDSGDAKDRPLVPGEEYVILLAYGRGDSYSAPHTIEAEAKITITL